MHSVGTGKSTSCHKPPARQSSMWQKAFCTLPYFWPSVHRQRPSIWLCWIHKIFQQLAVWTLQVISIPLTVKRDGWSCCWRPQKRFRRRQRANRDQWLSFLDYRNTPTKGMDSSPVQRLMSKRTKTLLPVTQHLLEPEIQSDVKRKHLCPEMTLIRCTLNFDIWHEVSL